MKVDLNSNYSQLYKLKHGSIYDQKNERGELCVENSEKLNRGLMSSGSSMNFGSAAKLSKSSETLLQKLINGCNEQTTIIQNLWSLMLAIVPRPLAIMLLPDPKRKNQKDKIAAACHGIASGLVGFAFATVAMYPIGKANKKVIKDAAKIFDRFDAVKNGKVALESVTKQDLLKDTKFIGEKFLNLFGKFDKDGKLEKINEKLNFDRLSKTVITGLDTFVFGIAKAALTIKLIPPIMKYLFGEGNKNQEAAQQQKVEPAKVDGGQK